MLKHFKDHTPQNAVSIFTMDAGNQVAEYMYQNPEDRKKLSEVVYDAATGAAQSVAIMDFFTMSTGIPVQRAKARRQLLRNRKNGATLMLHRNGTAMEYLYTDGIRNEKGEIVSDPEYVGIDSEGREMRIAAKDLAVSYKYKDQAELLFQAAKRDFFMIICCGLAAW